MNDPTATRIRPIDDGSPLLLFDPPQDDAAAYAVSTATCSNPTCTCGRMGLGIRAARQVDDATLEIRGPTLGAEVFSDGTDLQFDEETTNVFGREVVEWLRVSLGEDGRRAWLRERWRRSRGQIGDPAFPSGVPPENIEGMVSFFDVFPHDFDLTVDHGRHRYLADDHHCFEPACACDEVVVQFVEVLPDVDGLSDILGHVWASVHRVRAPEIKGPPPIQELWTAFLKHHGHATLRKHLQRMRAAARARPQAATSGIRSKIGRNAPCPCGSGKKSKRCCGP